MVILCCLISSLILLKESGISRMGSFAWTSLHMAVSWRRMEEIKELLKNGANERLVVVGNDPNSGKNAVELAEVLWKKNGGEDREEIYQHLLRYSLQRKIIQQSCVIAVLCIRQYLDCSKVDWISMVLAHLHATLGDFEWDPLVEQKIQQMEKERKQKEMQNKRLVAFPITRKYIAKREEKKKKEEERKICRKCNKKIYAFDSKLPYEKDYFIHSLCKHK